MLRLSGRIHRAKASAEGLVHQFSCSILFPGSPVNQNGNRGRRGAVDSAQGDSFPRHGFWTAVQRIFPREGRSDYTLEGCWSMLWTLEAQGRTISAVTSCFLSFFFLLLKMKIDGRGRASRALRVCTCPVTSCWSGEPPRHGQVSRLDEPLRRRKKPREVGNCGGTSIKAQLARRGVWRLLILAACH